MTDSPFMPGLELARRYYDEAIAPIPNQTFPELQYAAARPPLRYSLDVNGIFCVENREPNGGGFIGPLTVGIG
ncbi:MAG: hypothetical protein ACR2OU_15070 [Thermomicrobiales bacterium]